MAMANFPFQIKKGSQIIDRFKTRKSADRALKILKGRKSITYKGIRVSKVRG